MPKVTHFCVILDILACALLDQSFSPALPIGHLVPVTFIHYSNQLPGLLAWCLPRHVIIPESNVRRSLAAGLEQCINPEQSVAQRIREKREEYAKASREAAAKRRSSLAMKPARLPDKENEITLQETKKIDDPIIIDLEKEGILTTVLKVPRNQFNSWCLEHETTIDAWLTDEVIHMYMCTITENRKYFTAIDPVLWPVYVRNGAEDLLRRTSGPGTCFFPICESNHWVLLVIEHDVYWYLDPKGEEPKGNVEILLESMKRKRQYYEFPPPPQRDNVNCGVHVCLMAKSIVDECGYNWYSEEDVRSFRTNMKNILKSKGYELCPEPYNRQNLLKTEKQKEVILEEMIDSFVVEDDMTFTVHRDSDHGDDEVEHLKTIEQEPENEISEIENLEGSVDSVIPKLMEMRVQTPPAINEKRSKKRVSVNEKPRKQKEKEQKVPTGKPDELVKRVRVWFEKEFKSYVEDGKSFQRLEWMTDVLTAAIQKASAGDEKAVELIEKRCPPLECEEGEMCTQTEKKMKPKSGKGNGGQESMKSLMASYSENRAKTYNRIIGKHSKQCEIPIAKVQKFFEGTTAETNVPKETLKEMCSRLPKVEVGTWIEGEFSESEVTEALKKTKDTAPGVDGLRYHHLKWFDPELKMLSQIYNECREHRKIPKHWKEAETILLYKGGDESKPDNWRPISLMPTIYKLYSSLWNRRIRAVKGVMSKCQRGFQEREGCNESIGILRTAIDVAKGKKRNIAVAWLDLTNAFGSVPHELIKETLESYGFPEIVVDVVEDMYREASIRVTTRTEKSDQIMIKSGVKQGDPISPTLFNMCLESVIRRHLDRSVGHRCLKTKIKVLAFADDMAVLAESSEQLQKELTAMDADCSALNLLFKPAKCASLILEKGKVNRLNEVVLRGKPIRNLMENETYKYLGVQTGTETRVSIMDHITEVSREIDLVNMSQLAMHQKLDILKAFILPKMTYMYQNTTPKLSELKVFANLVMRSVKEFHNIPLKGSPLEYVQLPVGKGGLGVACPKNTALLTFLVSIMKKLWSSDSYIRKLYTDYLEEVAKVEIGKFEVNLNDLAEFLSDERAVDSKLFGFNAFTRVREVVRSLCKNKDSPLHSLKIIEREGKLAISVQATEESIEKIFTEDQEKKLMYLLKGS
ncbi:hypothetical protein CRE_17639 [Caenorhabditis remanei]|uniref:Reverse transcriptase domain-containing protein n=1 Tax=Caenorhabditis remanei TaxID=31234 RepID=E3NKB4_CAERE|nr:hypothetical protein CRE_17639 [Caenorhabditis remanei]